MLYYIITFIILIIVKGFFLISVLYSLITYYETPDAVRRNKISQLG